MKLPLFLTTVTPIFKAIAILLFVLLPFIGFYLGFAYRSSMVGDEQVLREPVITYQNPTAVPTTVPTLPPVDRRDCIQGEVNNAITEKYFSGKSFANFNMSGENGVLKSDFSLPISWGLDYAGPNDTRPNSGVGAWSIKTSGNNFKLSLARSSISDGSYTDFRFYEYQQNIFAIPKENMDFIVGPNKTLINAFFEKAVRPCW